MSSLCLRDTRQREAKNQQQYSSVRSHSVRQREYSTPLRVHGRGKGDEGKTRGVQDAGYWNRCGSVTAPEFGLQFTGKVELTSRISSHPSARSRKKQRQTR